MSQIRMSLIGGDSGDVSLFDLGNFMYDFNLAYEISRLATDPNYKEYKFSRYVYYRNGRPLVPKDRLKVQKVRKESPFELITIIAAVPAATIAIWNLVQIIEKVANAPLNRKKLRAEFEKLERENRALAREEDIAWESAIDRDYREHLAQRGALEYTNDVTDRLLRSPIRPSELELKVVDDDRPQNRQSRQER